MKLFVYSLESQAGFVWFGDMLLSAAVLSGFTASECSPADKQLLFFRDCFCTRAECFDR